MSKDSAQKLNVKEMRVEAIKDGSGVSIAMNFFNAADHDAALALVAKEGWALSQKGEMGFVAIATAKSYLDVLASAENIRNAIAAPAVSP